MPPEYSSSSSDMDAINGKAEDVSLVTDLDNLDISESPTQTAFLAAEMQQRCCLLLDELEKFQLHLKHLKRETQVEIRTFKGGLHAESKLLNKV
jgi:hypothetical protein